MSSESPSLRRKHGTKHKGRARLLFSREDAVWSPPTASLPDPTQTSHRGNAVRPIQAAALLESAPVSSRGNESAPASGGGNEADTPSRKRLSTQIRNSLDGYPTYHEMRLWLELAQALEQQVLQQERMLREQSARLEAANKPPSVSSLPTEPPTFPQPLPTVPRRARQRIHTSPAQMALFQKKR